MKAPYSLVSLWHMLQLPIGRLFWTFQRLASTSQFFSSMVQGHNTNLVLSAEDYEETLSMAEEFTGLCLDTSLVVTHEAAKVVCLDLRRAEKNELGQFVLKHQALHRANTSLYQLIGCLRSEAVTKAAMVLPPEKLQLYSPASPIFGSDVRSKFPAAIYDIDEAAKCLALGRSTATVFHLMRVLERALKAVNACLGLPLPNNPSWGIWLNEIRQERLKRGKNWQENDFFQDVWQRLDSIKDAQRDPTMHVQTIHTEQEASIIFSNTEAFMKKLASRMDENGDPKA